MIQIDINYLAVLVAALVNIMIGALWYSPVFFGRKWMKLVGMPRDTKPEGAAKLYLLAFAASLITAYILAHFVKFVGAETFGAGIETGFWAWLGFVAATELTQHIFSYPPKPKTLYILTTSYYLVAILTMGGILAVWQ